jgi:hypothetical protein
MLQQYIFKNLPDVLIQTIIDYANETPFRKIYDEKNREWIRKTNNQFALLNKVCKFMMDHPPYYYTQSGYYNPSYYNPNFMNLNPNHLIFDTICLTITLPIKAEGKMLINASNDGHTIYTMYIHYDGEYQMNMPLYYDKIRRTMIRKYKQKLRKKIDLTFRKRCKNMIDSFQECSFEGNGWHTYYEYKLK